MSRIHEALKKAEQERALSQQSVSRIETPAVLDPPVGFDSPRDPDMIMGGASALAGAPAPVLSPESMLARCRQTRWTPEAKAMLFFNNEDHAPGMEEFRTLRSRLYQAREKQPLNKVLVTSALPKEGKSFTSANLAQVIVRQHGKRVLLIDGDLRNPRLNELLGAEAEPGLTNYLISETDEFSIVQRGPMENLFFIPAGAARGDSAELIGNGRIRFLLSRMESLFDWIIVDSPPAALVSDPGLLAKHCDGVLLVVRSNTTPVDAARRAAREFADRPLLGVVLNGIAPNLSPYSEYYYSGYGAQTKAAAKN
jgi:protein-tyrosine kinase